MRLVKLRSIKLPEKPMHKMLLFVGIFFALLFGWYGLKKGLMIWFMSHYEPPAVTISAARVTSKVWQNYLTSVGTLTAINGVDVAAEVSGLVKEIRFVSGQHVKPGDVLLVLDTSIEQANLKDNQAKLKLAQINYERDKKLFQKNVISQSVFDTTTAQLEQAQAGVEGMQARIRQKTLVAPFAGKIGLRLVGLGQFLSAGTPIATLQSLNPLYVQFALPEQHLSQLYFHQPVDISVNLDTNVTRRGTLTAINSKVDQATRNILVQATIPNEKIELYPGMFALVKVWLPAKNNVLTLPQTAIAYSLYGDYVFIIKAEGKDDDDQPILHVYRQFVKVGERRGDEITITKGLKPGDLVVTAGQLKLQNGMRVVIDNSVGL